MITSLDDQTIAADGEIILAGTRMHYGELVPSVQSLEHYFQSGGTTVLQAAFKHSYFADPDRVRQKTPLYRDRARRSREHYPNLDKGNRATWRGREVKLDDNSAAQRAWVWYSGRPIERASGYGVRHIWGHPWDPDAFTAGWNLCYMPRTGRGDSPSSMGPLLPPRSGVRPAGLRHRPRYRSERDPSRAAGPDGGLGPGQREGSTVALFR